MQVPSMDVRELTPDQPLRDDEVEVTRQQVERLEAIKAELDAREKTRSAREARQAELDARPRMSRGSRRRR